MNTETTIEKLNHMRLSGMSRAFASQAENVQYQDLSFEERFGMIVDLEQQYRENKRLSSLLRKAAFRYPEACIEELDFRSSRGIKKGDILAFAENGWIRKKQNIIITGPTGAGKTYLSCALGNSCCREGYTVLYLRIPKLLENLTFARMDGSYLKMLTKLSRIDCLILDDWGIGAFNDAARRDFLEIFEDRQGIRSTIIATQLPTEAWHKYIGDPTIADAICDRVIHNAHNIKMKGGSMRKELSSLTQTEQSNNLEKEKGR